ncbi:MAG: hypothetical protein ACYCPQ_00745 [Elusimicrobiota bacterium]
MDPRSMDPLALTPQERRRRIVRLLAVAFSRWENERMGKRPPEAASRNGLASSGKPL